MKISEKDTVSLVDNLPKDWGNSPDSSCTVDDVMDAYFAGKEAGRVEEKQKFQKSFLLNLKLATSIAEELFKMAKEDDLLLNGIRLKASSFSSFEALFLADSASFLSDKFRTAYILGRKLKNKYNTDEFHLSFSFLSKSEDAIGQELIADGFFLRYEKGKEA